MANHRRFRLRQIEWRTLTKRIRFRQEMRPDLRWYQVFSYLVSLARLFFGSFPPFCFADNGRCWPPQLFSLPVSKGILFFFETNCNQIETPT